MKEQRLSCAIVLALLVGGGTAVGFRYHWRTQRVVSRDDAVWRLRYRIQLQASKDGARLRVALPDDGARNRVLAQELDHPGLRATLPRRAPGQDRQLECVTVKSGPHAVRVEFDIHVRPQAAWRDPAGTRKLGAEGRQRWLRSEPNVNPEAPAVRATLESLRGEGAKRAQLLGRIHVFCREDLAHGQPRSAAEVISKRAGTPIGRARAMVALCRAAQIPARLVVGFDLDVSRDAKPRVWVEARLNQAWTPFDPVAGFQAELPPTRVTVRRGGSRVVEASKGDAVQAVFSAERVRAPPGLRAPDRAEWTEIFDLTRLPLPLQRLLATLLLLPFGAVIIGLFRNLVGLRTFGTFAPVLLALAFVYSDAQSGLLVLVVILGGGLLIRHVLDALKLLMVARLGVVLTVVVTCLVLGISAVEFLSTGSNPQAVILPLVILTGLVEQIYITGEEDSVRYVLQLSAGTGFVALCCYGVLSNASLGQIVLRYPEAHMFSMAALILIGRYAGYRLTEFWRFHDLVRRPEATALASAALEPLAEKDAPEATTASSRTEPQPELTPPPDEPSQPTPNAGAD